MKNPSFHFETWLKLHGISGAKFSDSKNPIFSISFENSIWILVFFVLDPIISPSISNKSSLIFQIMKLGEIFQRWRYC